LLIVDDQELNLRVIARVLTQGGYRDVKTTTDAPRAVAMCHEHPPDVLLLDLGMPELDGFGVMAALAGLRAGPGHFPVLVLTGDATIETRRAALAAGADDFLTKPVDPLETILRVGNLVATHHVQQTLRDEKALLEDAVQERTAELEHARTEALARLALASEYRDDVTHEHAQRIGRTSRRIAEAAGAGRELIELIDRAASLHDIGKLAIPDAILLKPGPLDEDEFALMTTHTTIGGEILGGSRSPLLQMGSQIALTHHERWDGTGYPLGLAGDHIALSGRIVAVADVFDALTHARPYKDAWPVAKAVRTILDGGAKHFDPDVVAAFAGLDHEALIAPLGEHAVS
jgi:putative two-component system response regulator